MSFINLSCLILRLARSFCDISATAISTFWEEENGRWACHLATPLLVDHAKLHGKLLRALWALESLVNMFMKPLQDEKSEVN